VDKPKPRVDGNRVTRAFQGGLDHPLRKIEEVITISSMMEASANTPPRATRRLRVPDIAWIEIPAGPFFYQDGETRTLSAFWIARYPITNNRPSSTMTATAKSAGGRGLTNRNPRNRAGRMVTGHARMWIGTRRGLHALAIGAFGG
jgi:hypothetical protein